MTAAKVAVIIPAWNEEQTIAGTLQALHGVMPEAALFVVDNNSTDATAQLAREQLQRLGARGAVLHEGRQGKGNAVRRAFFDIDADVYVLTDADMTYPAEALPDLIAPVLAGEADMVYGDRLSHGDYARENKRPFHGFGNALVQTLVNWLTGANYTDIMTGYRALSRTFVKSYACLAEGFQIETEMSLFAATARMRVQSLPIAYKDRPEGSFSKLNTYKDGLRVLSTIANVFRQHNPIVFFSLVALALLVLCGLCGGVVVAEYLNTRYITHVPLAILAVAFGIVSVLAFQTGIMMDSINYHRKIMLESIIQQWNRARF
ncbi:MAG: glycosyltransferase [Ottowia sp.]|nr:glycosyltransferase [Ottowia sp.]